MREESAHGRLLAFFSFVSVGRWLMVVCLGVVFLATAGDAVARLALPARTVTGVVEDVTETRPNAWTARYALLMRTGDNSLTSVKIRNNGRLLHTLLDSNLVKFPATVQVQRGTVMTLSLPDGTTIRETAVPPLIQLFISLVPLLVLIFHLSAELLERPAKHT